MLLLSDASKSIYAKTHLSPPQARPIQHLVWNYLRSLTETVQNALKYATFLCHMSKAYAYLSPLLTERNSTGSLIHITHTIALSILAIYLYQITSLGKFYIRHTFVSCAVQRLTASHLTKLLCPTHIYMYEKKICLYACMYVCMFVCVSCDHELLSVIVII